MDGALVSIEPNNTQNVKMDPYVWMILYIGELNQFIEACEGPNKHIADYVVNSWENGDCKIHGRDVVFNVDSILDAIGLPNKGKEVR